MELLEYNDLLYNSFVVGSDPEIGYCCVVPPEMSLKTMPLNYTHIILIFMVYQSIF